MYRFIRGVSACVAAVAIFFAPGVLSAHEVYVLTPAEITRALAARPASPLATITSHLSQFVFWGFITFVVLTTVFFMSISRCFERICNPFFARMKKYAPLLIRLGVGFNFLLGAYEGALIAPEMSLASIFGHYAGIAAIILGGTGFLMLFGVELRIAAFVGMLFFAAGAAAYGNYTLTYAEFLGVFIFLIADKRGLPIRPLAPIDATLRQLGNWVYGMRYAILRVTFGFSVMYASVYAKLIHSGLALAVVAKYHLTSYWLFSAFDPDFLVLGAALIEFLCGALIMLGIEVRHTCLFLAFWLTLSLAFFQESVWPHAILFGLGFAFLLYGYDRYSLEGRFFEKGNREPVL